jgi:hypothetical protein
MTNESTFGRSNGALRMSDLDALDDLRYQEEVDRENSQRRRSFNYTANIEEIIQSL